MKNFKLLITCLIFILNFRILSYCTYSQDISEPIRSETKIKFENFSHSEQEIIKELIFRLTDELKENGVDFKGKFVVRKVFRDCLVEITDNNTLDIGESFFTRIIFLDDYKENLLFFYIALLGLNGNKNLEQWEKVFIALSLSYLRFEQESSLNFEINDNLSRFNTFLPSEDILKHSPSLSTLSVNNLKEKSEFRLGVILFFKLRDFFQVDLEYMVNKVLWKEVRLKDILNKEYGALWYVEQWKEFENDKEEIDFKLEDYFFEQGSLKIRISKNHPIKEFLFVKVNTSKGTLKRKLLMIKTEQEFTISGLKDEQVYSVEILDLNSLTDSKKYNNAIPPKINFIVYSFSPTYSENEEYLSYSVDGYLSIMYWRYDKLFYKVKENPKQREFNLEFKHYTFLKEKPSQIRLTNGFSYSFISDNTNDPVFDDIETAGITTKIRTSELFNPRSIELKYEFGGERNLKEFSRFSVQANYNLKFNILSTGLSARYAKLSGEFPPFFKFNIGGYPQLLSIDTNEVLVDKYFLFSPNITLNLYSRKSKLFLRSLNLKSVKFRTSFKTAFKDSENMWYSLDFDLFSLIELFGITELGMIISAGIPCDNGLDFEGTKFYFTVSRL